MYGLLNETAYYDVIRWIGSDGTFKFLSTQAVSKLWGWQKNNDRMDYEKVGRASKQYKNAEKDKVIDKVGEHFKWRFVVKVPVNIIRSRIERQMRQIRGDQIEYGEN